MSNHRYATPEEGSLDWHVPLNENFEKLDQDIAIRDEASNRSTYTPAKDAVFHALDTGDWYVGDGSSWNKRNPPTEQSTSNGGTYDRVVAPGDDLAGVLDAAGPNEAIYVETGTYQLSDHWIDVSDGVSIHGAPNATITPGSTDLGRRLITLNSKCHLKNLTFDSEFKDVNAVVISSGHSCLIEQCEFRNTPRGHYPLNSYKSNFTTVINNVFAQNGDRGLSISGAVNDQNTWNDYGYIANNVFRRNGEGPKLRGCRYVVVEGNTFQGDNDNSSNAACVLLQCIDDPVRECLVTGNTMYSPSGNSLSSIGVRVAEDKYGNSADNMISNNLIHGQDYGMIIRAPDTTVSNNLIANGNPSVLVDQSGDRVNFLNNVIMSGDVRLEAPGGLAKGNVNRGNGSLSGAAYVQGNFGF